VPVRCGEHPFYSMTNETTCKSAFPLRRKPRRSYIPVPFQGTSEWLRGMWLQMVLVRRLLKTFSLHRAPLTAPGGGTKGLPRIRNVMNSTISPASLRVSR